MIFLSRHQGFGNDKHSSKATVTAADVIEPEVTVKKSDMEALSNSFFAFFLDI